MSSSKNTKVDLRLDWCSYAAAKYACQHWHYSGCVPGGKHVKVGVWENSVFIGVVLFASGSAPGIGKPYGLKQNEVCELVRVALCEHITPVSRLLSIATRLLSKQSPGIQLIVSYADESQGHHGGIYQANGWLYSGSSSTHAYIVNGSQLHPMTLSGVYGKGGQSIPWLRANVDPNAARVITGVKHRYLYPLTKEMRDKILPLAKPYPKRANDE